MESELYAHKLELLVYRSKILTLQHCNLRASGYDNIMKPGYPRQCYLPMPPMPGMPVLPDGMYPVDYDDLRTLSETRANTIMACYNLNGPNNENINANIRDKVFTIAVFMGVSMKEEFREEYDRWEMTKDMSDMSIGQ